jgi:hypothetical protein
MLGKRDYENSECPLIDVSPHLEKDWDDLGEVKQARDVGLRVDDLFKKVESVLQLPRIVHVMGVGCPQFAGLHYSAESCSGRVVKRTNWQLVRVCVQVRDCLIRHVLEGIARGLCHQ